MGIGDWLDWFVRNVLEPAGLGPDAFAGFFGKLPNALAIMALAWLVAWVGRFVMRKFVLGRRRVDPMLGTLVTRLTMGLILFVGVVLALKVFGINILGVALTVGLIGAALALGMQNTVANVMGGISMAVDKPFEVGDRIQIGTYWGDVIETSLRSTKIVTPRREVVVIPNRILDEREIWNYTTRYPELRLDIPVTISYDSDPGLALQALIHVARQHPEVLDFPEPRAGVDQLKETGIQLQLRCFVKEAQRRWWVTSDLQFEILRRFRADGIEVPYPYRTIVDKKDLPKPKFVDAPMPRRVEELRPRRVLVASAGPAPATAKANTIVNIARDLEADMVVAYITRQPAAVAFRDGERAAEVFKRLAEPKGIRMRLRVDRGEVVDALRRIATEENCGALVIGAPQPGAITAWTRHDIGTRLRKALQVPMIVIPPDLTVNEAEVMAARAALDRLVPPPPPESAPAGGPP